MQVNVDGSHAAFEVAHRARRPRRLRLDVGRLRQRQGARSARTATIVLGPPTSRRWCYATSKLFDEHLALRLVEEQGLKVSILRLFNCYGPYNHPTWWGGPMSVFFEEMLDGKQVEIHGDGKQVRSFTYVSDTVDGFVRALDRPESRGEIINVGNDEPIAIIDLAAARSRRAVGIEGRSRDAPDVVRVDGRELPGRVLPRPVDREGARRVLGFEAKVGLDEGIARTLAYIRERRAAELSAAAA